MLDAELELDVGRDPAAVGAAVDRRALI